MFKEGFEKPIMRYGKRFITPVDLSNMIRMSKLGLGPHVGSNVGFSVDFSANPEGRKGRWFFRNVG